MDKRILSIAIAALQYVGIPIRKPSEEKFREDVHDKLLDTSASTIDCEDIEKKLKIENDRYNKQQMKLRKRFYKK